MNIKRKTIIVAALVMAVAAASCTRKIYVPVENTDIRHTTDTVTRYLTVNDTAVSFERVYESDTRYDSVAPILDSLNRVIGWDRYHFRERTKMADTERRRLMSVIDSLRTARNDTVYKERQIPVEVERIKEVARPLRWWQRALQWIGAAALALLAVAIGQSWRKRT
ncbi:hypothetical protein [Muribaculum intestinale]|uniref:hypothetical protein n=1 Tax=Muribaculum intestinale TaxID=1796646 RepID=UPI0025B73AE2|nr:hypothetical protein [Muribaculum intestinale]